MNRMFGMDLVEMQDASESASATVGSKEQVPDSAERSEWGAKPQPRLLVRRFYMNDVYAGSLPETEYETILRTGFRSPLLWVLQTVEIVVGLVWNYMRLLVITPLLFVGVLFMLVWFEPTTAEDLIEIARLAPSADVVNFIQVGLVYCFGLLAIAMMLHGVLSVLGSTGSWLGMKNRFRWFAHNEVRRRLDITATGILSSRVGYELQDQEDEQA